MATTTRLHIANHTITLKRYASWDRRKKYKPICAKLHQGGYGIWWACFSLMCFPNRFCS